VIDLIAMVKDEEKSLPRMLDSAKDIVEDMIIVDTGSSDKTVGICLDYGCLVLPRVVGWSLDIFVNQKNHALKKSRSEWVLNLDADEELTPELRDEIVEFVKGEHDALRIKRRHHYRSGEFSDDKLIRLFRRYAGYRFKRYNQNEPHEYPALDDGELGNYQNSENYMNHWGWFDMSEKEFHLKKKRYKTYGKHFDIMEKQFE